MLLQMQKVANGALIPSDEEAQDGLRKLKLGQRVRVEVKRQRNYRFLKKWFALMRFAFDYWEPPKPEQVKWDIQPEKSLERFRKDITILAEHFDATYRLDGSVRLEAKSISFGSMSEEDFEDLYSRALTVITRRVCQQYQDDELREIIDQLADFE